MDKRKLGWSAINLLVILYALIPLLWILDRIKSDLPLYQVLGDGFEYWFSLFWQGNGTGGGPLIALRTLELLVFHRAELGVAFYADP